MARGNLRLSEYGHRRQDPVANLGHNPLGGMAFREGGRPTDTEVMSFDMDRPIATPWWRRKPVLIGAGGAAALLLGGLGLSVVLGGMTSSVRVPAATVTIAAAQAGTFRDFTPLRAQVTPRDIVFLDALEGGQVEAVFARSGDMVQAGQPILKFRNTDLEQQVLQQQTATVQAMMQLRESANALEDRRVASERETTQFDFDIIRLSRTLTQQRAMFDRGFLSQSKMLEAEEDLSQKRRLRAMQVESAAREETLRKLRLPEIENELGVLRQTLAATRAKLDALTVRAPVAGRLAELTLEVGQTHGRGQRIAQITPDTGFKLQAQVDEYYLGRVKVGQTAEVLTGERNWPARVTRVDPQVKDSRFGVELEFQGASPLDLRAGQALEGRLSLGGDSRALLVPAGAFLETTGGDWAMVVNANGRRAERRRLRIGRRNAEQVEILGGLKAGETVITSSYAAFEKVQRVDLSK